MCENETRVITLPVITENNKEKEVEQYEVEQEEEVKEDLEDIINYIHLDGSQLIQYVLNRETAINDMMRIFSIQAPSRHEELMRKFIISQLATMLLDFKVDKFGNILVTKGKVNDSKDEVYPCIVAHMDKVHDEADQYGIVRGVIKNKVAKTKKEILWGEAWNPKKMKMDEYGGCGDDGGGIFVALEALKHIPTLKAAFFVNEENGCVGSGDVDINFFKDCGYIIQGDRKGSSDLILDYFGSNVVSNEFYRAALPIFEYYGFEKEDGSFTDVMELANRRVGVSVFNFSVGYYSAHTDSEFTVIDELINSTEFALNLINYLGNNHYPHTYEGFRHKSYSYYSGKYNRYDHLYGYGWDDPYDYVDDPTIYGTSPEDEKPKCNCAFAYIFLDAVDLECDACNPIIDTSDHCCTCGEPLINRELSYNCPVCTEIFVKREYELK